MTTLHKARVEAATFKATEKVTRENSEKMERLYHRISELERERFTVHKDKSSIDHTS